MRDVAPSQECALRRRRMYRCEICHELIGPGLPAAKLVVETRPRVYPERKKANKFKRKRKKEASDDPGGSGYETVREVLACASCQELGAGS